MTNGSLEKWLYSHNHFLDVSQRLNIMIDIALALEYLHRGHTPPVVHCDLKPNNVLLDEYMIAYLGDFGIAKLLDEEDLMIQTMTLVTIGYMSPEYGSEGIVSTKGDVYSFGTLLMETFTRKKPTDQMFVEEMSLKCWVKESLPSKVVHVVDSNLLNTGVRERLAAKDRVLSILQLASECSTELPEDRIDMKEVVARIARILGISFMNDDECMAFVKAQLSLLSEVVIIGAFLWLYLPVVSLALSEISVGICLLNLVFVLSWCFLSLYLELLN
ncbi:hypothetical protein CRYUN_Cryun38cG0036900 [Craigia yunnanensis]